MPVERGYESQVAPREGAPLPQVNPRAYGVGLAQAGAELGDDIQRRALRAYELDRREQADREAADFDHRFALHRQNMDGLGQEMRSNAEAGGAGHVERWREANEAARDNLFSGITDRRVLQRAQGQWDEYSTRGLAQEGDFAEAKAIAKRVTDRGEALDIKANRIRRGSDLDAYRSELQSEHEAIYAQHGLPDDLKEKLWEQSQQKLGTAFVQYLLDTNPQGARQMLDAGTFDHLAPNVLEQLRNGADVEIRRQEAAAAVEARAQQAAAREDIATLKVRAGRGEDVSAELPNAISAAEAMGDRSLAEELRGIGEDNEFAKVFGALPPLARQNAIAELRRKEKLTPREQRGLHWLETAGAALDERFRSDPVSWATQNASPSLKPPPLSDGLQARAAWRRKASAAYGAQVGMFSKIEADDLRARAAQSPAGQLEVANQLAVLGGRAAINAAREVAPGDAMLQQLVVLSPGDRAAVQMGADARKGNRNLIDGTAGSDAQALFNDEVGRALSHFPPAMRNAAFEASRSLYAAAASRQGSPDYKDRSYRPYITRGIGSRLANWYGEKVLLPPGYDEERFARALNNYKPSNGPRGPVFANGEAMTAKDLRRYIPRARPDGLYQFETRDGTQQVRARDGSIYVLGLAEAGQ